MGAGIEQSGFTHTASGGLQAHQGKGANVHIFEPIVGFAAVRPNPASAPGEPLCPYATRERTKIQDFSMEDKRTRRENTS